MLLPTAKSSMIYYDRDPAHASIYSLHISLQHTHQQRANASVYNIQTNREPTNIRINTQSRPARQTRLTSQNRLTDQQRDQINQIDQTNQTDQAHQTGQINRQQTNRLQDQQTDQKDQTKRQTKSQKTNRPSDRPINQPDIPDKPVDQTNRIDKPEQLGRPDQPDILDQSDRLINQSTNRQTRYTHQTGQRNSTSQGWNRRHRDSTNPQMIQLSREGGQRYQTSEPRIRCNQRGEF